MGDIETFFSIYGFYLWVLLLAVTLVLFFWLLGVQLRLNRIARAYQSLMNGVDEGNLEDALERQIALIGETRNRVARVDADLRAIQTQANLAVQNIGIKRFNPFGDTGGDQSFAVALLDAQADGIVISSIYSRNTNRIFAKPIKEGRSSYTLSEEEAEAITMATGLKPVNSNG